VATISDSQFATRLIADLAPLASVNSETGRISFDSGGRFDEERMLLFDLIRLSGRIPAEDATAIARDALFAAAAPPGLTLDRFTSEVDRLERAYLSRRPNRHVFLTQISIDPRVDLPRMVQDGVTISFPPSVPKRFIDARQRLLAQAEHSLYVNPPEEYRWLRASVSAKSHIAAGNRSLEAIEFRVALLNLGINRRTGFRWSAGKRKPVNSIALAPLHTLHSPSGALSTGTWWYEPNYVLPLDLRSRQVADAVELSELVIRRLRRLPYADAFKDWVRYYGRALGESDWAVSFILLWQALESITGTVQARHDATVRRAAFIFDDVEYSRRVLDNLRNCRNAIVHAQNDPTALETRLYILKRYVEEALMFHVRHVGNFDSVDEAAQFLDLPASSKELSRRVRLVKKAARFRGL
jgi:hypothetical protein